jgi:hypothetical protein
MLTRTASKLAAGCFAAAYGAADLGEIETKYVVQKETRPLQRRQAFEKEHHRNGNVVREVARDVILEGFIHHRLGQPLADVEFAARARRLHPIETQARYHGAEIAARLLDRRSVRCVPTQIGVLHDVLGLGARAEHAVGKPGQRAPMRLESRDVLVENRAHAAETLGIDCVRSRNTGIFSPPIASRVQARP